MKPMLLSEAPKPQLPTGEMPMLEPLTSSCPPSNRKLLPAFQDWVPPLCSPPRPLPGKKKGMRSEPLVVELSSPVDQKPKTCGVTISKPVYSAAASMNQPSRMFFLYSFMPWRPQITSA